MFVKKKCSVKDVQSLKAFRIKFKKFAAHAQTDTLIKEIFIPTGSLLGSLSTELNFIFYHARGHSHWNVAPPFFDSGGPQTGVWSTKTTKDGKCLSVIFIFLVENQYGLS